MARTPLGWGDRDLAVAAKVSPDTVFRLERGETLREDTIAAIRRTLERAGVAFIEVKLNRRNHVPDQSPSPTSMLNSWR